MMNKKMNLSAFFLCLLVLSGIAISAGADVQGYPRTVIDSADRSVSIQMPIERIIVTNLAAAEAVRLLNSSDKIVGVTSNVLKNKECFPDLGDVPDIGSTDSFNFEMMAKIAENGGSIKPDIIAVFYATHGTQKATDIAEQLSQFKNITIVGLDFYSADKMTEEMTKLGTILGKEEQAQDYAKWYNNTMAEIETSVESLPLTKVFFESPNSKGGVADISAYGPGSGMDSFLDTANGRNIAEGLTTYPKVDWEWVITQNPEVIIRNYKSDKLGWDPEEKGKLQDVLDEIATRPGAENVSAIKNHRVYLVYNDMTFGTDCAVGLGYLTKILHPDAKLEPNKIYIEYLNMLGLKYPEGRIFIYPEA